MGLLDIFKEKKTPREKAREEMREDRRRFYRNVASTYAEYHNVKNLAEIFEISFNNIYKICIAGLSDNKEDKKKEWWLEAYNFLKDKVNNIPDLIILASYSRNSWGLFTLDEIFDDYRTL